jgi:hypothetical protein
MIRATETAVYAFEVYRNSKRLCVAGIGDDGVLTTTVTHVVGKGRNQVCLRVGGLISTTREFVEWRSQQLKTGDEIRVKIVEATSVDRPKERRKEDPNQELKRQKRYVREMARKFGWQVTTKRVKKGQE